MRGNHWARYRWSTTEAVPTLWAVRRIVPKIVVLGVRTSLVSRGGGSVVLMRCSPSGIPMVGCRWRCRVSVTGASLLEFVERRDRCNGSDVGESLICAINTGRGMSTQARVWVMSPWWG
jgi:hypothetical protein